MDKPTPSTIALEIIREVETAEANYPPLNYPHEAYAVILEEVDEYWEEVRKKQSARVMVDMRTELIHIAAMAFRAIRDTIDIPAGTRIHV